MANTTPHLSTTMLRPLSNFPPTLWGSTFASFSFPHLEFDRYTKQVEVLKDEVKSMLMASTKDPIENIELIDLLCRLGVSYHFEEVIEDQLALIFSALPALLRKNDYDLSTTSTLFRVLRQHGYNMSCDIFEKFKNDSTGKFKEVIIEDIKGLLNLYEATHVSFHGENILEEAMAFARSNLESLTSGENPNHLEKLIKNALNRPHHKGIPRIETKKFISLYQEHESRNETLVRFAKIDFNRVQLLHQQELNILSRWSKELNFSKEFPYARDRIAEIYFWANGMHFEPKYAISRMIVTKYTMLISIVDDTYDAYATFEELQSFTNAFNKCNIDALDELNADYLKILYKTILDVFDETNESFSKEGTSQSLGAYYAKKAFKELVRGYHKEAQWSNDGYVPSFDEYICNGYTTSALGLVMVASFLGIEIVGIKEHEWLQTNPKIIKAVKTIGRLMNDICGHEEEQERGDCASGVECYMKQYNVSKKIAMEEIQKINKNAWKDVNEECMRPSIVTFFLLKNFSNIIRAADVIYETDDAYTVPLSLKEHVIALFIDNISL